MKCKICESNNITSTYIGETGRLLSIRINEHLKPIKSIAEFNDKIINFTQVQKHAFTTHGPMKVEDWEVSVLKGADNIQERKIMEAVEIRSLKPTLNCDNGISLIIELYIYFNIFNFLIIITIGDILFINYFQLPF